MGESIPQTRLGLSRVLLFLRRQITGVLIPTRRVNYDLYPLHSPRADPETFVGDRIRQTKESKDQRPMLSFATSQVLMTSKVYVPLGWGVVLKGM